MLPLNLNDIAKWSNSVNITDKEAESIFDKVKKAEREYDSDPVKVVERQKLEERKKVLNDLINKTTNQAGQTAEEYRKSKIQEYKDKQGKAGNFFKNTLPKILGVATLNPGIWMAAGDQQVGRRANEDFEQDTRRGQMDISTLRAIMTDVQKEDVAEQTRKRDFLKQATGAIKADATLEQQALHKGLALTLQGKKIDIAEAAQALNEYDKKYGDPKRALMTELSMKRLENSKLLGEKEATKIYDEAIINLNKALAESKKRTTTSTSSPTTQIVQGDGEIFKVQKPGVSRTTSTGGADNGLYDSLAGILGIGNTTPATPKTQTQTPKPQFKGPVRQTPVVKQPPKPKNPLLGLPGK